jgi:cell division protease FtsH
LGALALLALNYLLVSFLLPAPSASQAVQVTAFSTVQPTFSDPGLEALLEQQGVVVNTTSLDQTTPWWLNLLLGFGPTILLIAGFVWLSNRAGQASGGGLFWYRPQSGEAL